MEQILRPEGGAGAPSAPFWLRHCRLHRASAQVGLSIYSLLHLENYYSYIIIVTDHYASVCACAQYSACVCMCVHVYHISTPLL